jgi:Transposase, Mutator family
VERALEVELTDHLGYEPHAEPAGGTGNTRNGSTPKTLITDNGPVPIDTPRDRDGSFEPKIVRKRQCRLSELGPASSVGVASGCGGRGVARLRGCPGLSGSATWSWSVT